MSTAEENYLWLCENAGLWEVSMDNSVWSNRDGSKFVPKVRFSFKDTCYAGKGLDDAIEAARRDYD